MTTGQMERFRTKRPINSVNLRPRKMKNIKVTITSDIYDFVSYFTTAFEDIIEVIANLCC